VSSSFSNCQGLGWKNLSESYGNSEKRTFGGGGYSDKNRHGAGGGYSGGSSCGHKNSVSSSSCGHGVGYGSGGGGTFVCDNSKFTPKKAKINLSNEKEGFISISQL
jgi:hypothetical protein